MRCVTCRGGREHFPGDREFGTPSAVAAESADSPWRLDDDSGFVNPNSFQIYSMGADGIPNTFDDITPWTREDD